MPTKGKSFRRRKGGSSNSSNLEHYHDELQLHQYLPFPVASITTLLFLALLLSFLSAIYIGASRNNHNHGDFFVIDVLSSARRRRSSSEAGSSSANANGGDGSSSTMGNVVATDNTFNDNDHDTVSHNDNGSTTTTTIHSFQDLKPSEIHPIAGPNRHIVTPPADEKMLPVSLVTCKTTAGYLHIAVHPSWCPLGAQRFLTMVTTKYFSSKVVRVVLVLYYFVHFILLLTTFCANACITSFYIAGTHEMHQKLSLSIWNCGRSIIQQTLLWEE